jgi:hypothetical protein
MQRTLGERKHVVQTIARSELQLQGKAEGPAIV